MAKLLDAFRKEPSHNNARKLVNYADKHMMALCYASREDEAVLRAARLVVGR